MCSNDSEMYLKRTSILLLIKKLIKPPKTDEKFEINGLTLQKK